MIIAEIGSVHDGSFGNAKKMIDVAKNCGADIVKFQMHIAEHETLKNAPKPSYFAEETRFDYLINYIISVLKILKFHQVN